MSTSILMLTNTVLEANVTGDPVQAAGTVQHSVAIYPNNLQGRVFIEASLANLPATTDWFPLTIGGSTSYVQFPLNPNAPTGNTGDTGVVGYTFRGNYLWLRARLDRSYLLVNNPNPSPDDIALLGNLDKILLN